MVNQIPGPVISETMSEKQSDPLKNLEGDTLELNGGGMYRQFIDPLEQQVTEHFDIDSLNNNSKEGENTQQNLEPNNEKKESIDSIFEENKNNPATPLLVKVLSFDFIESFSTKDLNNIYKNLKSTDSNNDPLNNLIKAFEKTGIDGALTDVLIKISSDSDIRLKESKNGEVDLPKEFKNNKLLNSPKYKKISGLLANNYISFPLDKNGTTNFEDDLQLAIETTVNKVTYGKKIINKESIGYNNALQSIKFGDLENKLEALQYVYSFVNTSEGMKGAKSKNKFNEIKGEHKIKKSKYFKFRIEQIEKQINASKDNIEKSNLEKEKEQLSEELKKDDFEGEVFKAGKLDKNSEVKENDPFALD